VTTIAFWDIAQCSFVEINRHLRGAYCLHRQGDELHVSAISGHPSGNVELFSELQEVTYADTVCHF
jgi:hypothetical protein